MRFGNFHKVWRGKKNIPRPYFKVLYWTIYSYLMNKNCLSYVDIAQVWLYFHHIKVRELTLPAFMNSLTDIAFKFHMVSYQ